MKDLYRDKYPVTRTPCPIDGAILKFTNASVVETNWDYTCPRCGFVYTHFDRSSSIIDAAHDYFAELRKEYDQLPTETLLRKQIRTIGQNLREKTAIRKSKLETIILKGTRRLGSRAGK